MLLQKRRLKKRLNDLKEHFAMVGLKGGTEVEDLTLPEIVFLRAVSKDILPLTVKIGGPEARTDIRMCLEEGIDTVLAPMVESPYGLKNFVEATLEMEKYYGKTIYKAINVETVTCYEKLSEIYGSPYFKEIHSVTVGRSDLSGSMGKGVDDPEVMKVTQEIVKRARDLGKTTSVGGKITVKNMDLIRNQINPDVINTRHIIFDLHQKKDLNQALVEGLLFEIELYKVFRNLCPSKKKAYEVRIADSYKRAGLA